MLLFNLQPIANQPFYYYNKHIENIFRKFLTWLQTKIFFDPNLGVKKVEFETMALERKILKAVFLYLRYLFSFPLRDL
jgi:hypothetical protein